jgi:hypothetical protein
VISSIWDAPDPASIRDEPRAEIVDDPSAVDGMDFNVLGGGAGAIAPTPNPVQPVGPAQLFSRITPPGFAASQPAPPAPAPVTGGGAMMPAAPVDGYAVGAPGESIEVATGVLQPARGYQLEGGGAYRGPAVRGGVVHGAGYDTGGQPVPPALASQVETMVYGGMQVGNPHDPLLVWSSVARGEAVPAQQHAAPVSIQPAAAPVTAPSGHSIPAPMQQVRTVPMEPPAGVYAPAPVPQAQAQAQTQAQAASVADPFLRRAEAGGGDISYG